jgi:hypothetical protein
LDTGLNAISSQPKHIHETHLTSSVKLPQFTLAGSLSCVQAQEEEVDLSADADFHDAYQRIGRFLDDVYTHKRIHSKLG